MPELRFDINETELKNIEDFKRDCVNNNPDRGGVIGGRWTYTITPTGLGNIVTVKDEVSKSEINATDYGMW